MPRMRQTKPHFFREDSTMRKALGVLLLSGAAALFSFSAPDSSAQTKKGKATKLGTIELLKSKDGKFRFTVRNADGKYVGGSAVGHATEKEAKESAEELKSVIATATYVSKEAEGAKTKSDK
jgi:hypothetical protein